MKRSLQATVRPLPLAVLLAALAACASPQFDCATFPEFTGVSFGGPVPTADGVAILREAESFDRIDARAIVDGYVSLGAYQDAADFLRRQSNVGNSRGAVLLLIELSAAAGKTEFARGVIEDIGAQYGDGVTTLALAAGEVRRGNLDAALALTGLDQYGAGSSTDWNLAALSELRERLSRGRHRDAAQILRAVLEPPGAGTPLFSTLQFRGQTYIAGRADLVDFENVDYIAAQIAKSNVPDGIAKYSVLFAVADIYVELDRPDDAGPILSELVAGFTADPSRYSDEYLTPILGLQLRIGRDEDVGTILGYISSRLDRDGEGRPSDRRARELAKQLASILYSFGRSADIRQAQEAAATPRSRAILGSTIAWVEAMEGNTDTALQLAADAETPLARCWAMADVASALAMRGEGRAALTLADEIREEECPRYSGFAPAPDGSVGPYGGLLTHIAVYDENLFTTIAVAAAYFGDGETVCTAMNSGPDYRQWIDAVEEISALRTAAADFDAAVAFIRSARTIRPSDADDWSDIVARMVTQEPPTWSPPY